LKTFKISLFVFLLMLCPVFAARIYFVGVNDQQQWSEYRIRASELYQGSYFHHSEYTSFTEFRIVADYWGNRPNDEPFVFNYEFELPEAAVVIGAAVQLEGTWHTAHTQDLLTAESLFDSTAINRPRCLLRQFVSRNSDGSNNYQRYLMQVSPTWYGTSFNISITYLIKNTLELYHERSPLFTYGFPPYHDVSAMNYYFLDTDEPETQPVLEHSYKTFPFYKTQDGWWKSSFMGTDIGSYYNFGGMTWLKSRQSQPKLYLFQDGSENYYLLSAIPPLEPQQRPLKKILLLFDVGTATSGDREFILDSFRDVVQLGYSGYDSINVLLMHDLAPRFLRPRFVSASAENLNTLFAEMRSQPVPQLNATVQLLREAVDYFNTLQTDGEIWLLSTAERDANPVAKANDIIALTVAKLKQDVAIKILACGGGGNDYLYENLARLTQGAVLRPSSVKTYHLKLAMADLLSPALDLMEVDLAPSGGYTKGRYNFDLSRTHYPIYYPFIEIGRAVGGLPFAADFYGNTGGQWFHKQLQITSSASIPQLKQIKTLWHAQHVKELLRQPQSWNLIDEIGRIGKENHFVTPYSALVIPSEAGYAGFKRLAEGDTLTLAKSGPVLPEQFEVRAYPNPFNAQLQITVRMNPLAVDGQVDIRIYDLLGRQVRAWRQNVPAHESSLLLVWDGADEKGESAGSGVYFVSVQRDHQRQIAKITCLK